MHENRETSETPAVQPDSRSAGEGLYFVSSQMLQFSQFPPTFLQLRARGFANPILKKSVFVSSMIFLIVI